LRTGSGLGLDGAGGERQADAECEGAEFEHGDFSPGFLTEGASLKMQPTPFSCLRQADCLPDAAKYPVSALQKN
jgi:hypothetical protein